MFHLHCWEALKHSGLNNSLVRQKWAKNARHARARAPRAVYVAMVSIYKKHVCLSIFCGSFLLYSASIHSHSVRDVGGHICCLGFFFNLFSIYLLPMNVCNIFLNLLIVYVNPASCGNEFWKFLPVVQKTYLFLSVLHWSPSSSNEYCRIW